VPAGPPCPVPKPVPNQPLARNRRGIRLGTGLSRACGPPRLVPKPVPNQPLPRNRRGTRFGTGLSRACGSPRLVPKPVPNQPLPRNRRGIRLGTGLSRACGPPSSGGPVASWGKHRTKEIITRSHTQPAERTPSPRWILSVYYCRVHGSRQGGLGAARLCRYAQSCPFPHRGSGRS